MMTRMTRNEAVQKLSKVARIIKREPKYTVRVKGIDGYCKYLNRDMKTQKWLFASKTELERFQTHHTRKELEDADFGWVFSCEGVEIEEVGE